MLGPHSFLATAAKTWLPDRLSTLRRYGLAFTIMSLALLAGTMVHPLLPERIFITLFPAVAVISLTSGLAPALFAALIAGLVAIFFWMPPPEEWPEPGPAAANLLVFMSMAGVIAVFGHLVHVLVAELRKSEHEAELRADEMHHRIQNLFNVVIAIGKTTVAGQTSAEEFWAAYEHRLRGISNAQLNLIRPEAGAEFERLVRRTLDGHDMAKFTLDGPACRVRTSTQLVLGLHELATNSMKYGALSVEAGHVDISWSLEDGLIRVEWTERNGPPVSVPGREGFGSKVLRSLRANRIYAPEGLRVSFAVERVAE